MGKRFTRLENKVAKEYEAKGYSKQTSLKWGAATAAKVYRESAKYHHRCVNCGAGHTQSDSLHSCWNCKTMCNI